MTKSDLAILEKVFRCEIFGRVYQSKEKRLRWLCDEGYVEYQEYVLPGRIPIRGWALADRGQDALGETWKDVEE